MSAPFTVLLTYGFIRDIYGIDKHDIPNDINGLCLLFFTGGNLMTYFKSLTRDKTEEKMNCILWLDDECRVLERGNKEIDHYYEVFEIFYAASNLCNE